jgi:hypothetical protein
LFNSIISARAASSFILRIRAAGTFDKPRLSNQLGKSCPENRAGFTHARPSRVLVHSLSRLNSVPSRFESKPRLGTQLAHTKAVGGTMWGSRFPHDVPMDPVNAMHPQIILAILRAA